MNFRLPIFIAAATLLSLSQRALAQDPLVPEARLSDCSASAIEFVMRTHKVNLDFSHQSLRYVDGMMFDFHIRKLPPNRVKNHIMVMGCYAGEVFIKNLGGRWIYPSSEDVQELGPGPFVELPRGVIINPLVKVQKIYEDGIEESIFRFYAVVAATIRENP